MKRRNFLITAVVCILFISFSTTNAQEEENSETPYWYVSEFKIPFEKVDSLKTLIKKYTIPMLVEVKKAGGLLDYKVLIHHTGDEFSVVTMSKFPSWDAINKGAGWGAAFKIIEPDKNERQKISDSWNWVFEGASHIDNIYTEATHTPDK